MVYLKSSNNIDALLLGIADCVWRWRLARYFFLGVSSMPGKVESSRVSRVGWASDHQLFLVFQVASVDVPCLGYFLIFVCEGKCLWCVVHACGSVLVACSSFRKGSSSSKLKYIIRKNDEQQARITNPLLSPTPTILFRNTALDLFSVSWIPSPQNLIPRLVPSLSIQNRSI